jgi:hypothetical protein
VGNDRIVYRFYEEETNGWKYGFVNLGAGGKEGREGKDVVGGNGDVEFLYWKTPV